METVPADRPTQPPRETKKRNLVNQRNFRSRRKQYVTELEQKLQQYEREGVAATQRVQQAARLVLGECSAAALDPEQIRLGFTDARQSNLPRDETSGRLKSAQPPEHRPSAYMFQRTAQSRHTC